LQEGHEFELRHYEEKPGQAIQGHSSQFLKEVHFGRAASELARPILENIRWS
jgi:hypothetical protein